MIRRPGATLRWALLLLAASFPGCGPAEAPDARPRVAVSVAPQAWMVERLAGDLVDVEVLVPARANPTMYEPTLSQLEAVSDAALYVKIGHPHFAFERTWLERLLRSSPGLRAVDASEGIAERAEDPHMWLSPPAAASMVEATGEALEDLLPEHAERIAERRTALGRELEVLDAELREQLAPWRGRAFLVFHPAWGAFARRYGLVQLAVESEQKEPDPRELARLIEGAREADIRVVFVQPQFSHRAAEVLAGEIGARVGTLDPLAYDLPANLRSVAQRLVEGFAP